MSLVSPHDAKKNDDDDVIINTLTHHSLTNLVGHKRMTRDRWHLFEQFQHHLPLFGLGTG